MWREIGRIPYEPWGIPLFGAGWLLVLCAVGAALAVAVGVRQHGWSLKAIGPAIFWGVLGVVIYLLPSTFAEGIPIRGYGVMLVVAIVAGVGLSMWRARRVGLDPEAILSLALWFFVSGIVGARLFYVIEYWDRAFRQPAAPAPIDWSKTLTAVAKFSEGGLVVYGALIGVLIALVIFVRKHKLPGLALADIIIPGMLLGQAIGRVGCLLNGCCYGDTCELPWAITFPADSPPYDDQLRRGLAHGIVLSGDPLAAPVIRAVVPDSPAAKAGVVVGDRIEVVNTLPARTAGNARTLLMGTGEHLFEVELAGGKKARWTLPAEPPSRPLPVHPAQLYSFVDALVLAAFLWAYYPFRRRDGELLALALTIHPITRFLLEVIRVDESPVFGTPFSISQNVSILILLGAVVLWVYILRQPRGTRFDSTQQLPSKLATTT